MLGINIALDPVKTGAKKSKLSPLFPEHVEGERKLTLNDLTPNPLVATNQIQVVERVVQKIHEFTIDKTKFTVDRIDKERGEIDVSVDLGISNLTGVIVGTTPAGYESHFRIAGSKLYITNVQRLAAPQTFLIGAYDTSGTASVITLQTSKGSVKLTTSAGHVDNIPAVIAQAYFVAKTFPEAVMQMVLAKTIDYTLASKMADGTIPREIVNHFAAGRYSIVVMQAIVDGKYSPETIDKLRNGTIDNTAAEELIKNQPPVATFSAFTVEQGKSFQ